MNKSQQIGVIILIIAIVIYFVFDYEIVNTFSGVLCAIGIGFVLKWIPFKKENYKEV